MSASSELQQAIGARLALSQASTIGDGSSTQFSIVHSLGMASMPAVTVTNGALTLVLGTDYDVQLVDANTLKVIALGLAPASNAWLVTVACLRVTVPIVAYRKKELASEIEAATAKNGLCINVMPPLPTKALQEVPFVFFEEAEVVVRIIEQPAMNNLGADAYDLVDDVAAALQWQLLGGNILAHPLQLAPRPTDMAEDRKWRIIDVKFTAVFGLQPPA